MKQKKNYIIACILPLLWLIGCEKEESLPLTTGRNTVADVIKDNFNLRFMSTALQRSRLASELSNVGPYTVLVPSDDAFSKAGYSIPADLMGLELSDVVQLSRYHILDGQIAFDQLPFVFNQELYSWSGKLYATRWISGLDTILTINGSRILSRDILASNGYLQVIDRILEPYEHERLSQAVAADTSLTFFSEAIKASGITNLLDKEGTFSVFAPNNVAMEAMGYHSVQEVHDADPLVLKQLVNHHIIGDIRFIYDYILSRGEATVFTETMLDANRVTVTLISERNKVDSFSGITLRGTGNLSDVKLTRQDILTGNGVLHVVDGVLRVNQ